MSKKYQGRYNIQFDITDASHLQVIEILDGKRPRGKASYIADAILHFENCDEIPIIRATPALDEKIIEGIVNRILSGKTQPVFDEIPPTLAEEPITTAADTTAEIPDDAKVDEAIKALGAENIQAIMGAVNAFRKN